MRPTVLLDCDGPMCDFVGGVLDVVHRLSALRWTRDELIQWDIFEHFNDPLFPGLADSVRRYVDSPGFCACLKPMPGAIEGVRELRKVANVQVVTAPWKTSRTWPFERVEWLRDYFNLEADAVKVTSYKDNIHGDYLVDDKVTNVAGWVGYQWLTARDPGRGIVWNTPHNRFDLVAGSVSSRPGAWASSATIKRVDCWQEVIALVRP